MVFCGALFVDPVSLYIPLLGITVTARELPIAEATLYDVVCFDVSLLSLFGTLPSDVPITNVSGASFCLCCDSSVTLFPWTITSTVTETLWAEQTAVTSASDCTVSRHIESKGKHTIGRPTQLCGQEHMASCSELRKAGANPRSHASEQSHRHGLPASDNTRSCFRFWNSSTGRCCIRFPSNSIRCSDVSSSNVPRGKVDRELLTSDKYVNFGIPRR